MSSAELDNGEEIFEDAQEEMCDMDLATSMEQAKMAVNFFFNNRFEEARALMIPWADKSMYHALGYGTFMYLQAIMTFDPKDIEAAITTLKQSLEVCNRFRRKNTFSEALGRMVKKTDYKTYTEVEIHAELCYAECLLLRAVLTFMEDETLMSFLKGGMKIRACYQSYKECWHMLESKEWEGNAQNNIHFESGVRMGVGTFNLLISQLPSKILKLLEVVGFSGNRGFGLRELEKGFQLTGSLRRVLCALVLLGYHTIATYALCTCDGDLEMSQSIIDDQLKLYPNGAWFLFFNARLHFIQGYVDDAIEIYKRSWQSQHEWRQFHHICYWELFWCNIMRANFIEAQEFATRLLEENEWSKATYAYQKACCMCMRAEELTPEEKEDLRRTMRSIPTLKKKIAGKSLPVEKFAAKKAARFFAQGETLMLPALELIFAWNGFRIVAKRFENIEKVYKLIENELAILERTQECGEYFWDDYLLLQLLKGSCLAHMKSPLQAVECFKILINNDKKIKEDAYLIPNALLEIALLHMGDGDYEQAKLILEHANKGITMWRPWHREENEEVPAEEGTDLNLEEMSLEETDESVLSDPEGDYQAPCKVGKQVNKRTQRIIRNVDHYMKEKRKERTTEVRQRVEGELSLLDYAEIQSGNT